jgi:hypothetical protein
VRGASAQVVGIAAFSIIDRKARRGFSVLEETAQQRNWPVHFAHEFVAQLMAQRQRAQGTDRVGEERVRSVERIDVTLVRLQFRPARGLDRSGRLEGQFVKILFPGVERNLTGAHQAQQIAVGADVVESVVVDADVGDVRGHPINRVPAADIEEGFVARDFELVNRGAELEALGPLGPAARGIFALDRENGCAAYRIPSLLQALDFLTGQGEEPLDGGKQRCGSNLGIDLDHKEITGGADESRRRG